MALNDCSILVSNVSFVDNLSTSDGAAVLIDGGATKFTSCLFDGNETAENGGAVQVLAGSPEFRYCLFVLNKAQNGAAIHQSGGTTVLENSVLDRNDATGGVLHAAGGEIHSEHSIVTASVSGAALRASSGSNHFSCGLIFDEAAATPLEETGVLRSSVLVEDPMFCQPGFLNYTYSEASPLVAQSVACGETIGIAGPPCAMTVTSTPGIPKLTDRLLPPAPNPFNPTTMLGFELSRPGRVDLEIYDVRGRLVDRPIHGQYHAAGSFSIPWRGRDTRGQGVASGVYLIVLRVDGARAGESMRVVLLK
jgi:hypothetical protein